MAESGTPKRKRRPQHAPRSSRNLYAIFGLVVVLMFILLIALVIIILGGRSPESSGVELTVTSLVATNQQALMFNTQVAAPISLPTTTPTFMPSATPIPTLVPTPTIPPAEIGQPGCQWVLTTRADPNGVTLRVQEKLDQAILPVDVRVMVYVTGDECLLDYEGETPNFFPRHTDFNLIVHADDRFLNADIDNDNATRSQLGFLVRNIINVLENNFSSEQTRGAEPGIITMMFINGDVIRTASFTQTEIDRSPYNEYEVGTAIISAIGGLN
jgi:hypothetical protein